ncbi:MAG: hypothetical protein R2779_11275 [Crocinitomicaceae bacterium]
MKVRAFSGYQDTLIEDFAMSYPTVTLLKDYTSVPWDHYKNNPTNKTSIEVPLTVRNSYLNGGANITSAGGGRIEVKYNGTSEGVVNQTDKLLQTTIRQHNPFQITNHARPIIPITMCLLFSLTQQKQEINKHLTS